jgi:hypothetical protein
VLLVGIAFLSIVALTPNLWLSSRAIPLVPLIPLIAPFPPLVEVGFLTVLVLSVLYSLVRPSATALLFILALLALAALQDQNRIMPWLYQTFLMYLVLAFHLRSPVTPESATRARNLLGLIIICMYFWSGILKINPAFRHSIVPFLLSPLSTFDLPLVPIMAIVGIAAPVLEAGWAIALLFPVTRKLAVIGIECMHVFILAAIGPFGLCYNSSVWPWNIMMMVLVPSIFWRSTASAAEILWVKRDLLSVVILLAVGILPALRVVDRWDTYLSFGMYIGNISTVVVSIDSEQIDKLPPLLRKHVPSKPPSTGSYKIDLHDVFLAELNSPPYPEPRNFRSLAAWLCTLEIPISIEITRWTSPIQRRPSRTNFGCINGKLVPLDD